MQQHFCCIVELADSLMPNETKSVLVNCVILSKQFILNGGRTYFQLHTALKRKHTYIIIFELCVTYSHEIKIRPNFNILNLHLVLYPFKSILCVGIWRQISQYTDNKTTNEKSNTITLKFDFQKPNNNYYKTMQ